MTNYVIERDTQNCPGLHVSDSHKRPTGVLVNDQDDSFFAFQIRNVRFAGVDVHGRLLEARQTMTSCDRASPPSTRLT
jgi:hypothetical protein